MKQVNLRLTILLVILGVVVGGAGVYFVYAYNWSCGSSSPSSSSSSLPSSTSDSDPAVVEIQTGEVQALDPTISGQQQASVDGGHQPWRLDPVAVAAAESGQYGFDTTNDAFVLKNKEFNDSAGTWTAQVTATHSGYNYTIHFIQPETQGDTGIWWLQSISYP